MKAIFPLSTIHQKSKYNSWKKHGNKELYGKSETALKSTLIKLENKMNLAMRRGVIMQRQNLRPSADDNTQGCCRTVGKHH